MKKIQNKTHTHYKILITAFCWFPVDIWAIQRFVQALLDPYSFVLMCDWTFMSSANFKGFQKVVVKSLADSWLSSWNTSFLGTEQLLLVPQACFRMQFNAFLSTCCPWIHLCKLAYSFFHTTSKQSHAEFCWQGKWERFSKNEFFRISAMTFASH